MMKTTFAAMGVLAMLSAGALASPPPNDVGVTGMGGGVYFNPDKAGDRWQPANHDKANGSVPETKGSAIDHATTDGRG